MPSPAPWILDEKGHVYSQPLYKPAPFTGLDGVEHPDHMAGLVALPYGDDNGHLIKAAPEMLKALYALAQRADEEGDIYARNLAAAAIAEAEDRPCEVVQTGAQTFRCGPHDQPVDQEDANHVPDKCPKGSK